MRKYALIVFQDVRSASFFSLVLLTPSYALGLPPGRQTWLQVHFPLGRNTTMTKTEGKTNGKFISCFSELILYERYMCSLSSSAFEDMFTFGAWTMNLHEDFTALKMQPWEFQLHFFSHWNHWGISCQQVFKRILKVRFEPELHT